MMRQSWNEREYMWRGIFFVTALLVIWIVNSWIEAEDERKRDAELARLVSELKEVSADHPAWQDSPVFEELSSLEVIYIPRLLKMIDQEDEAVGRVLAAAVSEIGMLALSSEDWTTAAEWKSLWNNRVVKAETDVPGILADDNLAVSEQAARLVGLGVPAVPHLLDDLKTGRGSEASMTALEQLLGPSTYLPSGTDKLQWRRWARTHDEDYAPLTFTYE